MNCGSYVTGGHHWYIFYSDDGEWMIGPDYKKNAGGIKSIEKGLLQPPLHGWEYCNEDGVAVADDTITVTGYVL